MANNKWKSLWEGYDDDGNGPDEAKKPKGPRPNAKYWENHENADIADAADETTGDRRVYRTYEEDDRASDEYGGFGYSGPSYSYGEAFDDSDTDWYRRNSFRYGQHADYSPSSLFRSAFSSRSYFYGSADSDAKNKAIRALRNLTRSANTIVDKTTGKKTDYAVQFSAGEDSNGMTSALNEEKQRVVFVSPDELLGATTTEEEDSIVDALTGFVLLRVQISQDVDADVIQAINATGLMSAGLRAAQAIFDNKETLKTLAPEKLASDTAEDYLAGMLAKSMLTRLARRKVVSDWGGFAPYFIRHAKKFMQVRENLEKAEPSLEAIVGRLAYNMVADENPLELPKEVEDLASKHLGEEVAPAELLEACRKLVAEINALLRTAGDIPMGAIESALAEMFKDAQDRHSGASAGSAERRKCYEAAAEALGAVGEANQKASAATGEARDLGDELNVEMRAAQSIEQMIKKLEKLAKEIDQIRKLTEGRHHDEALMTQKLKRDLAYAISSRPQATEALRRDGVKEIDNAIKEAGDMSSSRESLDKLEKALTESIDKAHDLLKKKRNSFKKSIAEYAEKLLSTITGAEAHFSAAVEDIKNRHKKFAEMTGAPVADVTAAQTCGEQAEAHASAALTELTRAVERVNTEKNVIKSARSLSGLQSALTACRMAASAASSAVEDAFYDYSYHMHGNRAVQQLVSQLTQLMRDGLEKETAMPTAVDAAMSEHTLSDSSFLASMLDGLSGGLLEKLRQMLGTDEFDAAAKATGNDAELMRRLAKALETGLHSGKDLAPAKKVGATAAQKLKEAQSSTSPVDGELFGDKIEAKTKLLTGEAIGHVNDEARNAPEEEYVAYLDHNSAKPKIVVQQESGGYGAAGNNQKVVREVCVRGKSAIDRIRNALQFHAGKRTIETHGLLSGDLDEGSLHKLNYDCEHIWSQKTLSKLPDVAVGILVDQSGSMSGPKINNAREICILLAEAVRKIAGVRLYVYGHTANNGCGGDLTIYEHYSPSDGANLNKLGGIRAHSNNYDGYAIKDVAKRLSADEAKKKYLFVIADGLPAGSGYGGDTAAKHVASVCKFTRERLKIGTYAFAVGVPNHQQNMFKQQYGDKHVVFVNDVIKCLPQIVRFLRNTMQQERKLVGVED